MARKISKPDVWHVVMRPAGSAGWDRVPGMIPMTRYTSTDADRQVGPTTGHGTGGSRNGSIPWPRGDPGL